MPKLKHIRLDDELADALVAMENYTHRKASDLIKEAIVIYLRAHEYLTDDDKNESS